MASLSHIHKVNLGGRPTKRRMGFTSKSKKEKGFNSLKILVVGVVLLAVIVITQAFRWQIIYASKFKDMSQEQYRATHISVAPRGKITAADNTVLAVDEPVWDVYATLSKDEKERKLFFDNKEAFATEVSGILGITKEEVESKLTDDFVYASIKKDVSTEKKKALEDRKSVV